MFLLHIKKPGKMIMLNNKACRTPLKIQMEDNLKNSVITTMRAHSINVNEYEIRDLSEEEVQEIKKTKSEKFWKIRTGSDDIGLGLKISQRR